MHTSRLTSSMTAPHKISRVCLFLLWFASHFIFLHSKLVLHSFESLFFKNRSTFTFFSFGLVPLAGTTGQRYSLHREQTNVSSDVSLEGFAPVKSRHLIRVHDLSKSQNCKNNNLLLFLELLQKKLLCCHPSIFSSCFISCMPVSALMAIIHPLFSDNKRNSIICDPCLGHCSLGILIKYLCDKSKGH